MVWSRLTEHPCAGASESALCNRFADSFRERWADSLRRLRGRPALLLLATLATVSALVACGSSKKVVVVPPPPITVAFSKTSAPPASVLTNSLTKFAAVVNNDSFNTGVTWAVTCADTTAGACGSFANLAEGSDINDTYIAPAVVPTGNTVTVTATSVTDTSKSVTATITIIAPLGVTFSSTTVIPTSMLTNTKTTLAAVVTNDPKNAGVAWSVTCPLQTPAALSAPPPQPAALRSPTLRLPRFQPSAP